MSENKSKILKILCIILIILSLFAFTLLIILCSSNKTEVTPLPLQSSVDHIPEDNLPEEKESTIIHRGTAEAIPEEIKLTMEGKSMKPNSYITYEDLCYLTIPHYDFNYNEVSGHLIVAKELADEVLDIFSKLYEAKYPIERMELIDKYDASDFESIEHNNTSAFNYRVVSTGTGKLSNHALGRAIDINPQQNPYVYSGGKGSHENAREFWSRDISNWSDPVDRASAITNNSDIYRIFKKYGWIWGGDWSPEKDYQHFEK